MTLYVSKTHMTCSKGVLKKVLKKHILYEWLYLLTDMKNTIKAGQLKSDILCANSENKHYS